MLIQQLIDLAQVRSENLKNRTDLLDLAMDGRPVTQKNDYFELNAAQKGNKQSYISHDSIT